jgi:RNA polymerase sigma factor for flagellar operon FliA
MVDRDCLVQAAYMAMISVIDKYNGSVKFTTYACMRVNGAMMDELRDMDIVPRLTRIRERKRLKLIEDGKNPEECMTPEEFNDSFTNKVDSIDRVVYKSDHREVTVLDSLVVDADVTPLERDSNFRHLCRGCTLEEEIVLYLYYVKDHNMKYIGEILRVRESRVSQIHSEILERLRKFDFSS